ncbi:STAS domain-containing protein [Chitinimonas arctica]|uniref:STAS domain-containing protein n=1 Tax=Chitinimonas arctica TaxID=2594795 RepID=A0A516SI53_9NEIS|nr:STAS domain-containing protein [Chitinimonas arctica]QDQ27832.1 STAS domain-containing protein [Chitinimonas arctica]
MAISASYQQDCCTLCIVGPFTIYAAVEAKARLLQELTQAQELEVDLSGVVEFDTAGIQLLLLLKREATRQGKPLRFNGHSKAVLAVIDLYNMAGVFGDPVLISSGGT